MSSPRPALSTSAATAMTRLKYGSASPNSEVRIERIRSVACRSFSARISA
jgi:hypothetical protein